MFPENNYGIIPLIGDDSKVDTPLPIPNREVKHFNGENSVSEDSKLPIFFCIKKDRYVHIELVYFYLTTSYVHIMSFYFTF